MRYGERLDASAPSKEDDHGPSKPVPHRQGHVQWRGQGMAGMDESGGMEAGGGMMDEAGDGMMEEPNAGIPRTNAMPTIKRFTCNAGMPITNTSAGMPIRRYAYTQVCLYAGMPITKTTLQQPCWF